MARTYVVTGAASGIGRALTEQLRTEGHIVFGADLKNSDIDVDLTTPQGRRDLVLQVCELSGGSIDAVVAVAGIAAPIPATVAVNYFGTLATLEGLLPMLAGSDSPRAAVVASLATINPTDAPLLTALVAGNESKALELAQRIAETPTDYVPNAIYNTTKHAIALWIRKNAPTERWAGAGVPLNAAAPGVVATPMTAVIVGEGRAAMMADAPSPLNGPDAPASAPAALLAWLTSEQNTHVTGQIIFIDGGAEVLRRPERV